MELSLVYLINFDEYYQKSIIRLIKELVRQKRNIIDLGIGENPDNQTCSPAKT